MRVLLPNYLEAQAYQYKLEKARAASQVSRLLYHDAQRIVAEHPARFKVLACGRRFGKTELISDKLSRGVMRDNLPRAYFAPTYKMLDAVFENMVLRLHPITERLRRQEKQVQIQGGGVIDFWSLDSPDVARGRKYKEVAIDEAAMIAKLEYAWNEVIRPTLTDYAGGAFFPSTPKGRNYFWMLYQRGLDPAYPDWMSWSFPTVTNPFIDPAEVEQAKQTMPDSSFRQEYLAEFMDDYGAVFRGVLKTATAAPIEPIPGEQYYHGVDWGRHHDFTVHIVLDKNRKMVAMDRFNQVDWTLQRGRIAALARKYIPATMVIEANSAGEPNIEELKKLGFPIEEFMTTPSSKPGLIDALALAIETENIQIFDEPVLVHELQSYEMERLPGGTFRFGAPTGGHDDTVIALALALHGVDQPQYMVGNIPRSGSTRQRSGYYDRR